MLKYNYKDEVALAYDANRKRLRLEGRLVLDRILNEALAEMTHQFTEGLNRGEVMVIEGSSDTLRGFLRQAAARELGLPAPKGGA